MACGCQDPTSPPAPPDDLVARADPPRAATVRGTGGRVYRFEVERPAQPITAEDAPLFAELPGYQLELAGEDVPQ